MEKTGVVNERSRGGDGGIRRDEVGSHGVAVDKPAGAGAYISS